MTATDERIVELSKAKLAKLLVGACGFVVLGVLMLRPEPEWSRLPFPFDDSTLVRGTGLLAVGFFGLCALFGVRKLFERKPGLVLDSTGILDNTSGIAAGLVPWPEVVGFDIFQLHGARSLVVKVTDPDKYANRGGAIRRALNKANVVLCGSPIAITSSSLKIDFDELLRLCSDYLEKYGDPGARS
ncbi:MAG TPA: STM3941 family protein [Burkholderiaceae bacterium]